MKIIEQFTQGKFDDDSRNEDKIIVTDNFIAMLDGATSKRCPLLGGRAGGRFAVDSAPAVFASMPAEMTAADAVVALSRALRAQGDAYRDLLTGVEPPTYGMVVYSRARREVWRVGDLHFRLGAKDYPGSKLVDEINYAARALMVDIALRSGMTEAEIMKNDVGRDFIQPALDRQHFLANRSGTYCYGVIDGRDVPAEFIEVYDAADTSEIVLATDGYPVTLPTLAESEAYLADVLRDDPLMYKKHKGSKGLQTGQVSFDDRAYIRFTP